MNMSGLLRPLFTNRSAGAHAPEVRHQAELDFKTAVDMKNFYEAVNQEQAAREAEERRFQTQSIIGRNEAILAAARPLRNQVRRELAEALRPVTKPMYDREQGDIAAIAKAHRERLLRQVDGYMGIQHGDPHRFEAR